MTPQLLNEKETAQTLNCTVSALRRWRRERRGPKFVRIGRLIRYNEADLLQYIESNTERTATEALIRSYKGGKS